MSSGRRSRSGRIGGSRRCGGRGRSAVAPSACSYWHRHGSEHGGVDADLLGLLAHAHEVDEHLLGARRREQSTNSCTVIRSTARQSAVSVVARRSNMKPGCSPAAWNRVPARAAGGLDALRDLGAVGGQVVVGRGGDDVLARLEQGDDVVGVRVVREGLAGGVEHDVGVEGEDRVLVVGGEHARSEAGRRACPASTPTLSGL